MPGISLDYLIVASVSGFILENQLAAEAREGRVRGELTSALGADRPQLEERVEERQLYWSWVSNQWRDLTEAWARANDRDPASLAPRVDKGQGKGD